MKKIYIEITNCCNLDCNFCIKNSRKQKFLTTEEFKIILEKVKPYTKYLYFHILGEPLLHPKINEFINLANKNFYVNITTNGYLIDRLKSNIRQLNISLHSYDDKYNISIDNYMNNIFKITDKLNNTYISYRFWVNNKYQEKILDILNKHYNTNYKLNNLEKNNKLSKNVFLNIEKEFIWPDLNNDIISSKGTCYALKDHIGILSDGTIVPCCLDTKKDINLGNIYKDDIDKILHSKRATNMYNNFRNNKKVEELCKRCSFTLIN